MAPFVVDDDELAAGAEEVVVDPLVGAALALAPDVSVPVAAGPALDPALVPAAAFDPIAAAWKAAKVLSAVGLTAKTIPF
jgi:hypothetical protein